MWGSLFSKDPLKDSGYDLVDTNGLNDGRSIWTKYTGKKKTTGDLVTIFTCQNDSHLQLAKSALKRMKTLRHPNILNYLDGAENDKIVHIITEKVTPLDVYLLELKTGDDQNSQRDDYNKKDLFELAWGLYQICRVLSFLHDDCKLIHSNLNLGTIYVDQKSNDWKLGCFEFVQQTDGNTSDLQHPPTRYLPAVQRYEPPQQQARGQTKQTSLKARDMWLLGTMIWEIFNSNLSSTLKSSDQPQYKKFHSIPKALVPSYCELINVDPSLRPTITKFLDICRQQNGFMKNVLVDSLLFLEEIQLKDNNDKQKFFQQLPENVDEFSSRINENKLLPLLLNAYEFGNSGSVVLPTLFKLGKNLNDQEYKKKIVPIITKLFQSTDRMTRFRLLQQLDLYVEYLSPSIINDEIFQHICTGFTDQEPAIREATVKSVLYLAPKLSYKNLNVELMKHFSRLQTNDDQGVIRTNTIVCLGKIAHYLNPSLRSRLLISAFSRGCQDSFSPSRQASVYAFGHSEKFFTLKDIATKIVPILCTITIDPEIDVRTQAFKTIHLFLTKLETVSENPELAVDMEKEVNSTNINLSNETSWTSWALTSLTSKIGTLTTKQIQPSITLSTSKTDNPTDSPTAISSPVVKDSSINSSSGDNTTKSKQSQPVKNKPPAAAAAAKIVQQNRDDDDDDDILLQERQKSAIASFFNNTSSIGLKDDEWKTSQDTKSWSTWETNPNSSTLSSPTTITQGNDWGDDQNDDSDDKWEDFTQTTSSGTTTTTTAVKQQTAVNLVMSSSSSPTPVQQPVKSSWTQDTKPTTSMNDWNSDQFFNDVLTSTTTTSAKPKPKLKR